MFEIESLTSLERQCLRDALNGYEYKTHCEHIEASTDEARGIWADRNAATSNMLNMLAYAALRLW